MDKSSYEAGKAQALELVVEPLKRDGMRKPHRMRTPDYEAFLDQVAGRLAHLTPEGCATARGLIFEVAAGSRKTVWPELLEIAGIGHAVEPRPLGLNDGARRFLRSAAGRAAWDAGEPRAVALCRYLERMKRPPIDAGGWRQIDGWQAEIVQRLAALERAEAHGFATERELAWREHHRAAVSKARAYIFEEGARDAA